MNISSSHLAQLYSQAHDVMRNIDGLQPQEAFDELLKFIFCKESEEVSKRNESLAYSGNGDNAKHLQRRFKENVENGPQWIKQLWRNPQFYLSNSSLLHLHRIFNNICFGSIDFDIRSAALKEFLPPEVRRGLGIYLTPDDVAKMAVDVLSPMPDKRVYDPACGSGTFLVEVLKSWKSNKRANLSTKIWASDKNPRMLLLTTFNIGQINKVQFHGKHLDALDPLSDDWPLPDQYDFIFTNPPFGVTLDNTALPFNKYETCKTIDGKIKSRQQSEVMFVEQTIRYLRPGGYLAIVLPRSVITNSGIADARSAIGQIAHVFAVVALPPEAFQVTGTQTNTVVCFFKKYGPGDNPSESARIAFTEVSNMGYDSTGREKAGNQLPDVPKDIHDAINRGRDTRLCRLLPSAPKEKSLSLLGDMLSGKAASRGKKSKKTIKDVAELVCTGKTPARSSYTDSGLFLVKVGNLTGQGVDWSPRERNFIDNECAKKRIMLRPKDILLTSSAHSPDYIARKVDIITAIPSFVGGAASFVGEIMLIRPKQDMVDPFLLLAYLRASSTMLSIQRMIRGQTAHLHPVDLQELELPDSIFCPRGKLSTLRLNLENEAKLSEKLNLLVCERAKLLKCFAI